MLKKMGYALVCTAALVSTSLYSLTALLSPSMVTDWPIASHGTLVMKNGWFDPKIEGFCEIIMEKNQTAELTATVKVAEVTLNGVVVNVNQPVSQMVQNGT